MKNLLRSQAGFTLLETTVQMGLAGVVLLGSASLMQTSINTTSSAQIVQTRDGLILRLEQTLHKQAALDYAAQINTMFGNCYYMTNSAFNCVGGQTYSFDLYEVKPSATATAVQLSGDTTTPFYYTTDGAPCYTPHQGKCLISVVTSFQPYCMQYNSNGATSTCTWAEYLEINYTISIDQVGSNGQVSANGALAFPPATGVFFYNQMDRI